MSSPVKRSYDARGRQARAQQTRQRVMDVAHDRFIAQGYGRTTIADIARGSDVSVETIYSAFGNAKVALLAVGGLLFIGLQGLWQEAMDTLALTLAAVLVSLLIGIPLGVWAGLSHRVERTITPGLDFMQTMPTFVYLAPLTLFFLIGPLKAGRYTFYGEFHEKTAQGVVIAE